MVKVLQAMDVIWPSICGNKKTVISLEKNSKFCQKFAKNPHFVILWCVGDQKFVSKF